MYRNLFLTLFVAGCLPAQNAPVPPAYQDLYTSLSTQIASFDAVIHANWTAAPSPVVYAPQLVGADSTQFTQLLEPNYYSMVVIPQLLALQALGSKGVTVHISFPILYQPFYVSNPSQYQSFVNFYQQLARDVRARGLKLIVESVVGSSFPGNQAATFSSYLKGLSWTAYMNGRAQNVLNVAQLIQPDYLSVITEPDTEAAASGQANAGTVSGSTQLLQTILSAVQQGAATQVKIGAGAGTWIPSFADYVKNFAATSIQYFDMHIYPVNRNFLTLAMTAADSMHAVGKQAAISEAWDYKVRDSELGKLSYTELYARDPFSFWAPIDIAFFRAIVDFANYKQMEFVSPFWSHYFAAYLDYNTYGSSSPSEVMNASYKATNTANMAGKFTSTGVDWMNHTISAPDSSAPAIPASPVSPGVFPSAIQLTWPETIDNVGVAAYRLYRNGSLLAATSVPQYNDQGLTPGATYKYSISAFDVSGNVSPQSAVFSVQTVNTTPPTVPTRLIVGAKTKSSIALTWTASTGIGGIGGYRVLRGTSAGSLSMYANPTTTSYTDMGCRPSTLYYYAVESFNPNGATSAASAAVSATTLAR